MKNFGYSKKIEGIEVIFVVIFVFNGMDPKSAISLDLDADPVNLDFYIKRVAFMTV
jgi:hypothetical protein